MSANGNILEKINRIGEEELYLVEQDLCFHEKVSIAFLLFADEKSNAHFILQKLLILSPTPNTPSDILESYAKINKNWKPFLVEAIAIVKANKVLRKLGLPLSEIRTHFLPHIPEMSLHINPILKALYYMCEMLTQTDAGKMVLNIRDGLGPEINDDHLRFYDFNYLEVFLLDWITKRLLDASGSETTDMSLLITYFKLNEIKNIKDMLTYSLNVLNLDTTDSKRVNSLELQTVAVDDSANNDKVNDSGTHNRSSEVSLSGCYKIQRESAGFILIINQRNFHRCQNPELKDLLSKKPLNERIGTDVDKVALATTFSAFGYKPIERDNLNHIDVLGNIREVVKRSIIYDSLIVCVLTHGFEGLVYASDSVQIKIDQIQEIICAKTLLKKPKMLIIQACQGDTLQKATIIDNFENDSSENSAADYADMIKAMSTVPGFASLRHTKKGSWFIQTLCKKVNELGDRDHMLEILTEVNAEVGDKRGFDNVCMTPISSQTLTKKFRLPSRLA